MAFFLQSYPALIPNWTQIIGVFAVILIFAHFMMLGVGLSRITGIAAPIEIAIAMGWGVSVLILSFWGIFFTAPLYYPALALFSIGLAMMFAGKNRPTRQELWPLGKLALIMLPFLLLMASWRPSHWDTFLNLLPNAQYLWDFDQFPRGDDAITPSVFPALPYNTQLIGYLAGFWQSDYPVAAMTLANILWQALFGLTLARILTYRSDFLSPSRAAPIRFSAIAGGMIIATALSPGFRLELTLGDYGEPSTMVLAAWLMVMLCQMLQQALSPQPVEKSNNANILAIGLLACAFINIRQSNAALFLSIWSGMAVSAWLFLPNFTSMRHFIVRLGLASILPLSLWLGWRIYVKTHFQLGELGTRPIAQWEFSRIPDILQGMGHVIAGRPFMFLIYVGLILMAVMFGRRYFASLSPQQSQNHKTKHFTADYTHKIVAALAAAILFWQIMLMVLYLAVIDKLGIFGADKSGAKSFYRYNSHLILAAEICVILLWQKWWDNRGQNGEKKWRWSIFSTHRAQIKFQVKLWAGRGLVAAFLILPFFALRQVRYDLQMPRPILWNLAEQIKPLLQTGDRIAIMIPQRQKPDASFDSLRGLLTETSPRHARLTIDLIDFDQAAWAKFHTPTGFYYHHVLILCLGENDPEKLQKLGVSLPNTLQNSLPGQSVWLTPDSNGQFQIQNFAAIPAEFVTGERTPLWHKFPWVKSFDKNSYCIKN